MKRNYPYFPLHAILSTLLLISGIHQIHAQNFTWAITEEAEESQYAQGLEVDQFGNIIIQGSHSKRFTFGDSTYYFPNLLYGMDFIAKYGSEGQTLWFRSFISGGNPGFLGGPPPDRYLQLDLFGNIYYHSRIRDSLIVGDSVYYVSDYGLGVDYNGNFLSFDSYGTFRWVKFYHKASNIQYSIDHSGDLLISGLLYNDSLILDGMTYTYPGYKYFSAKMDNQGNVLWVSPKHTREHFFFDEIGNTYVYGNFLDSLTYGDTTLFSGVTSTSTSDNVGFVAKLDQNMEAEWVISTQVQNESFVARAKVEYAQFDGYGNLYLGGRSSGHISVNQHPFTYTKKSSMYLAKLDPQLNLLWLKSTAGSAGQFVHHVSVDQEGEVFIDGRYDNKIDTLFGQAVELDSFISIHHFATLVRPDGTVRWVTLYDEKDGLHNISPIVTGFGRTSQGDMILLTKSSLTNQTCQVGPYFFPLPPGAPLTRYFIIKLNINPNIISGTVFRDLNQNLVQDPGESGLADALIQILPDSFFVKTDEQGNYEAPVDTGSYTIVLNPIANHQINPAQRTISFSSAGTIDSMNNFAADPLPVTDFAAKIVPLSRARPGFEVRYRLIGKNIGNIKQNADLVFSFDSALNFQSSNIPPVQNGQSLSWNLNSLDWNEAQSIDVRFSVPASTPLGTALQHTLQIFPSQTDVDPSNNIDSLVQTVSGSFDPNDKQAFPEGGIAETFVQSGKPIDYLIRFQNTGTDTAFTVIIRDTLDSQLDAGSLKMLSASHAYKFETSENGAMTFRFNNILLPDSTTDEPNSHGFVAYSIKPRSDLKKGNVIRNTASIYFDYNSPVITNTTETPVEASTTSIQELQVYQNERVRVYPNPAKNIVHIEVEVPLSKNQKFGLELFDFGGKSVLNQEFNQQNFQIDLSELPGGIYVYKLIYGGNILGMGKISK